MISTVGNLFSIVGIVECFQCCCAVGTVGNLFSIVSTAFLPSPQSKQDMNELRALAQWLRFTKAWHY